MDVEKFLISLVLFLFSVFLYGDLETAIGGVSAAETLQPLLSAIPVVLMGALFFSMFYWGFND